MPRGVRPRETGVARKGILSRIRYMIRLSSSFPELYPGIVIHVPVDQSTCCHSKCITLPLVIANLFHF